MKLCKIDLILHQPQIEGVCQAKVLLLQGSVYNTNARYMHHSPRSRSPSNALHSLIYY